MSIDQAERVRTSKINTTIYFPATISMQNTLIYLKSKVLVRYPKVRINKTTYFIINKKYMH